MKKLTILIILTMMALGAGTLCPEFAMGAVTISTPSDQSFDVSDGEKDAANITLTKTSLVPTGQNMGVSNGIRICIPDELGMQWAGVDLGAGGTATRDFQIRGYHLVSWNMNMNIYGWETITLVFDKPILGGSVSYNSNVSNIDLTIQSNPSNTPTASVTTYGTHINWVEGNTIELSLWGGTSEAIKMNPNLAKKRDNCYLSFSSTSFVDNTYGYPFIGILKANAMQVTNYTPDTTAPFLSSWNLNMNEGKITLNFNEPVKRSSFNPGSLSLRNSLSPTKSVQIDDVWYSPYGGDGKTIELWLSAAKFNAIVDYAGGGLCTGRSNSYLALYSVKDMAEVGNDVTGNLTGIQVAEDTYTANTVVPTKFGVTKLENGANTINDGVAGTPTNIYIKGYNASGFRALNYNGTGVNAKVLTFSGAASSPAPATPPTATDNSTLPVPISFGTGTNVDFTNGKGSSAITLYNKETAHVKATQGAITTSDADDLDVTVAATTKTKLAFTTQPPDSGVVNSALVPQPVVAIRDQYGNQVPDAVPTPDTVLLSVSSSNTELNPTIGTLSASSNPMATSNGAASFNGAKYNNIENDVFLCASSPSATALTYAFSNAIDFATAVSSTVEPVTIALPQADFELIPTNDTPGEKFSVLKFKVKDVGGVSGDGVDTLIDGIQIAIGGTGANASTDIAGAILESSDHGQIATAASITNSHITFGSTTPESGNDGDLDAVPAGGEVEYTVKIYMKPSKMTALDTQTYTFGTNESLVYTDTGLSSKMKATSPNPVTTVTGTITVIATYLEIVKQSDGASSVTLTAGLTANLKIRATDANKNIDTGYAGVKSLRFSGLSTVNGNPPKIGAIPFLSTTSISFAAGVSNTAILTAHARETAPISVEDVTAGNEITYVVFTCQATVNSDIANKITIASGNGQNGIGGFALANPLVVTIKDQWGNPVIAGTSVTFAVAANPPDTSTPASLSAGPWSTNSDGQVSAILTLGNKNGEYRVTASSVGLIGDPSSGSLVTFTATATVPDSLSKVTGTDNQTAVVGQLLPTKLKVKLEDNSTPRQPVAGATINFTIESQPQGAVGASLSSTTTVTSATAVTNGSGEAEIDLRLGTKTGTYTVRATYASLTAVDFTSTATNAAPYKAVLTGPSSVNAATASEAFTITIKDQYDNASNLATGGDMTFNIASSPALGAFYGDEPCIGSAITTRIVTGGSSAATFYFKSTATGTSDITIVTADTRLNVDYRTGAIANFTVTPKGLDHFTVTAADTSTMTVGGTRTITVKGYDVHNNLANLPDPVSIIFSGASASPSGNAATCSNSSGGNIAFGSATILNFSGGIATTTFKPYKANNAAAGNLVTQITATSGATLTPAPLSLTVKHGDADHLKFHDNILSAQVVGTAINFGTTLDAVDLYGNICDGANGATAYTGSRTIGWTLGAGAVNNGPETGTDTYTNPVVFAAGRSETTLSATLYYAQTTTITPSVAGLTGVNTPSNSITIAPAAVNKIRFAQQPSETCVSSQALAQQPHVSISDIYGNVCTNATGEITLAGSTTNVSYTPVSNGALSATGGLSKTTSSGLAAFAGVKYSYPETVPVYIRASAVVPGITVPEIYSFGITFTAVKELTVSSVTAGVSDTVSSIANASAERVAVFAFKITDAGADGLPGRINKIVINRSGADGTGNWTNYINSATLSDGSSTATGAIGSDAITFGTDPAAEPTFTVPDKPANAKTYTLRIALKTSLPEGADGKVMGFTMDANTDIKLNTAGTSGLPTESITVATAPTISVVATNLVITGTGAMNAGASQNIIIIAKDRNDNIDKDYHNTGVGKSIKFSGAVSALDVGGTVAAAGGRVITGGVLYPPTCTDYNTPANAMEFEDSTPIRFTSGVSSSTITMTLYKAETAIITAEDTDVTSGYNWIGLASTGAGRLTVSVSGGTASKLSWGTQPKTKAVANSPLAAFMVVVTDTYGNVSSSSGQVTVTPSEGIIALKSLNCNKATISGGVATFNDFAVYATDGAYPKYFALTASSTGVTPTAASGTITLEEKYTINFLVKDSVSAVALSGFTFTAKNASQQDVIATKTPSSNSFQEQLIYGAYSFVYVLDKYVTLTSERTVGVAADAVDGTYDNIINWTEYMTTLTETTADYRVMSSFVYDENTTSLSIRLWLERRGKIIVSNDINKLGVATVEAYEPNETPLSVITIPGPGLSNNEALYTTIAATYKTTVTGILSGSNSFGKALESGKTYFVKCKMYYGGLTGDANTYESGATFTVTVTQQLSNEIISKIGVAPGQTLVSTLAGKTDVTAAVGTIGGKVDTVQSAVTGVKTDVAGVSTSVGTVSGKVDTVSGTVGAIQTDVSTTLPAKVKTELEKGVISQMLTRNTVLREDDSVKIRYRTASKLSPTLTIYKPDGVILSDYNGVKMKEISNTGIYEYEVTAKSDWGIGDFTAVCSESTKNSTDSMVLTIKALYTAGAGVEESVDAVGEAVSKVYTRQKSMEGLLGTPTDTKSKSTILGKVNGLNTTMDSLNLTTVSADAKNARINAQNVYNEIENITKGIGDVKAQAAALKELSQQLADMKLNLKKTSEGLAAETAVSGGVATTQAPSTVSVGTTTVTTTSGGGDTTIVNQYVTATPTTAASPRYSSYTKNYAPGTYRTKISVSEGAVSVADYNLNGIIASTEKRLFDGQSSIVVGRIGKALEELKAQTAGAGTGTGGGTGAGGAKDSDIMDLNNRLEELTALVNVLSRMIETTTNKPIVEGWFEQS